jgi:hypothetical protein
MKNSEIINRVANSNLITIDLESLRNPGERILIDIKDQLYQELILREKEFRAFVRNTDWSFYQGKNVAVTCTSDAIIPNWAFMLLAAALQPYVNILVLGDLDELEEQLFSSAINGIDLERYRNARVVIKGCSKELVPSAAYVQITNKLVPVVASLMFGEPCSTVPVFKNKL